MSESWFLGPFRKCEIVFVNQGFCTLKAMMTKMGFCLKTKQTKYEYAIVHYTPFHIRILISVAAIVIMYRRQCQWTNSMLNHFFSFLKSWVWILLNVYIFLLLWSFSVVKTKGYYWLFAIVNFLFVFEYIVLYCYICVV